VQFGPFAQQPAFFRSLFSLAECAPKKIRALPLRDALEDIEGSIGISQPDALIRLIFIFAI
jgi:hypothetical protein